MRRPFASGHCGMQVADVEALRVRRTHHARGYVQALRCLHFGVTRRHRGLRLQLWHRKVLIFARTQGGDLSVNTEKIKAPSPSSFIKTRSSDQARENVPRCVCSACTPSWKHRRRLLWAESPGTDALAASSSASRLGQISQESLQETRDHLQGSCREDDFMLFQALLMTFQKHFKGSNKTYIKPWEKPWKLVWQNWKFKIQNYFTTHHAKEITT